MTTDRRDRPAVLVFLLVAYAAGWLVCLPIWLSPRRLAEPWAQFVIMAMMYTPALGVLVATRLRRTTADALGLRFGGSLRQCVPYFLFALLALPALGLAAPFVAAALGLVDLDLAGFSGFRAAIDHALAGAPPSTRSALPPIPVLVAVQLLQIPVAAIVPNGLLAFGEEIGWRGFLLPRLLGLGQWPALVITGVVWGLWHAPVLLLGYNYPLHPRLGVLIMVGFCVVIGILLGWLRLATGSIWPGVIGHGAVNASASAVALFARSGSRYDSALVGLVGVTGWILPVVLIMVLVALRRLPVRDPHH